MGSDRGKSFNQLVNVGALSGLAAGLPSEMFAKFENAILGETPENARGAVFRLTMTPHTPTSFMPMRTSFARIPTNLL